ncbi:MAG: EF-P 5-aminopentanol modification-associated protein YfmH, partial [Gemmiger sp.]
MNRTAIHETAQAAANCTRATLPSGLTVLCRTMPGYSTVHAMYATAFGSVDRDFTLDGRAVHLPAGTAHFAEHKMFESEEGDAFERYAATGASANAFTSYERTCYVFSATQKADENLDILLDMVGHPYFTRATIAKEQGIIGQEIKMYDDSPDWRLLTGLFRCLYREHPLRDDIAGTVESIAALTPELLYACTDAFYRPGNMVLSVAGNITMERVLAACSRAGLDRPVPAHTVQRAPLAESGPIPRRELCFEMPVTKPCFALGYREAPIARGDTRQEILCDMLPTLVCGEMTALYRTLYDKGLVNPEFDGDYVSVRDACIIAFTGESSEPRRVAGMVKAEIDRLRREGVDPELFTLVKNQMYGEMLAD